MRDWPRSFDSKHFRCHATKTPPRGNLTRFFVATVLLGFVHSCATPDTEPGPDPALNDPSVSSGIKQRRQVKPEKLRLEPLLIEGDGFAKIRKYFRGRALDGPVSHIDVDFNGDGRIDFQQIYDSSGSWVEKERSDIDGNGTLDVTYVYRRSSAKQAPRLFMQEVDSQMNGRISVWKYFNEDGQLLRREIDRSGLGRADLWEYYENNLLVRIDRDQDGDGKPDDVPKVRKSVNPQGPDPFAKPDPVPLPEQAQPKTNTKTKTKPSR